MVRVTRLLNEVADQGKGKYAAVHLSIGALNYEMLDRMYETLNRYPDSFPNIRQLLYNPDDNRDGQLLARSRNPDDQMKKMGLLKRFFDTHVGLKPDEGELKTVLDNYRAAVKRAVDEGDTVLVNSFGNEGKKITEFKDIGYEHADFQDLFTMTGEGLDDAVIHVTGSDPNNTVMDVTDDIIYEASTPGTDTVMPTVAAPSHRIALTLPPKQEGGRPRTVVRSGTSSGVALTVGAVTWARIASGNTLSARDTVKLIKDTAHEHTNMTRRQMGHGLVDLTALLEAAGKTRPADN
jgi:hypothetical protein